MNGGRDMKTVTSCAVKRSTQRAGLLFFLQLKNKLIKKVWPGLGGVFVRPGQSEYRLPSFLTSRKERPC